MINSLVLAYYYSVEMSSTGQILRRFFPHLPSDNFFSTIITLKSDCDYETNNCRIIGINENLSAVFVEKVIRNLGMNDLMMTPDYYRYSWGGRALKAAIREMKKRKFDYLHTISFPSSSHLIGYKLKKKYGIPWVAQFYDPWHGNPYRPIEHNFFKKIDAKNESLVANYADMIILPCKELVEEWLSRYGRVVEDRIIELPFITEPLGECPINKEDDTLIISMIGTSNYKRMSISFFEAVRQLIDEKPNVAGRIIIFHVGYITEEEKDLIKRLGLEDVVVQTGRLSECQCEQYFQNADVFLAIDANTDKNYFFPSKLLKYFSYQRPILGLVTKNSVMSRELAQSGHVTIAVDDLKAIKDYLYRAITDYPSLCGFDKEYRNKFYPSSVIDTFTSNLNQMIFNRHE